MFLGDVCGGAAQAANIREEDSMVSALFDRRRRAGLWVLAVLVVAMALVAWQTLQTGAQEAPVVFKVERFAAMEIDPVAFTPSKDRIELDIVGSLLEPGLDEPEFAEVASQEEAEALLGYTLRRPASLPQGVADAPQWAVLSPVTFDYTVDLARWEAASEVLGLGETPMPLALDGATLTFDMSPVAFVGYGGDSPVLLLGQGKSPTLTVPPQVDVEGLRELVLASPLLPPDVANQLGAMDNWNSTMVVPLPLSEATSREVSVDGVTGLLVSHQEEGTLILWQKDGVLYGLYGEMAEADLLTVANSLS